MAPKHTESPSDASMGPLDVPCPRCGAAVGIRCRFEAGAGRDRFARLAATIAGVTQHPERRALAARLAARLRYVSPPRSAVHFQQLVRTWDAAHLSTIADYLETLAGLGVRITILTHTRDYQPGGRW